MGKLTCAIAKKPDREVEGREVEVVVIIVITQTFGRIVALLCFTTRLGSGSPVGNSFTIPKTEALPRKNGWDPQPLRARSSKPRMLFWALGR